MTIEPDVYPADAKHAISIYVTLRRSATLSGPYPVLLSRFISLISRFYSRQAKNISSEESVTVVEMKRNKTTLSERVFTHCYTSACYFSSFV
jgi:hypothetical protein